MTTIINSKTLSELFGEQLGPDAFQWELWCGNQRQNIISVFDSTENMCADNYKVMGWARASSLPVRPRADGIALMLWSKKDCCQFWMHLNGDFVDTLKSKTELIVKRKERSK